MYKNITNVLYTVYQHSKEPPMMLGILLIATSQWSMLLLIVLFGRFVGFAILNIIPCTAGTQSNNTCISLNSLKTWKWHSDYEYLHFSHSPPMAWCTCFAQRNEKCWNVMDLYISCCFIEQKLFCCCLLLYVIFFEQWNRVAKKLQVLTLLPCVLYICSFTWDMEYLWRTQHTEI